MKRTSLPAACLLLLLVSSITAQTAKSFRITGTVVNGLNGSPVQHSHLTVWPAGQAKMPMRRPPGRQPQADNIGADTDAQGRFSLSVPAAGSWGLRASATGYPIQSYDEHENYSTAIVLTEQAPAMEVQFRLLPNAGITGTVLDEAGEAVRGAQVFLFRVPRPGPDGKPQPMTMRSSATTDDRGYYEFADLLEGEYKIMAQARPWYASTAQRNTGVNSAAIANAQSGNALDPSLDVAYPLMWYPGRENAAEAETLALHPGDNTQADFQLSPVPALHLQVLMPAPETSQDGNRAPVPFPMIQQVVPGLPQGMGMLSTTINRGTQGQYEIAGLPPGMYTVRLGGGPEQSRLATVQLTGGGTPTLDFSAATSDATVTIHLDGDVNDDDNQIQVTLTNAETAERFFSGNQRFGPGAGMPPPVPADSARGAQRGARSRERTMQVPPGKYEVVLTGQPELYLTGMTAKSAETTGRYINLTGGTATLTLHVVRGKASVTGFVKTNDQPVPGAMVMLVPAGLGDPKSMTWLARDQTNTDGSFNLAQVIPGQYILLAIDHGWQINWKDPSTLNRYLIHGVPLDLRPGVEAKQDIEAQAP